MPFAVRYSSKVVRRNVPLIRNSKGMGLSDCKRAFTSVERAYRRRSSVNVNKSIYEELLYHITSIHQYWTRIFG